MDSLYLIPSEMNDVNGTEVMNLEIVPVLKTITTYSNDSLQFNDIFNMSWGRKFDSANSEPFSS